MKIIFPPKLKQLKTKQSTNMSIKPKRKTQSYMIDCDLIEQLPRLQLHINKNRTAADGAISLSDIVNQAIRKELKSAKS